MWLSQVIPYPGLRWWGLHSFLFPRTARLVSHVSFLSSPLPSFSFWPLASCPWALLNRWFCGSVFLLPANLILVRPFSSLTSNSIVSAQMVPVSFSFTYLLILSLPSHLFLFGGSFFFPPSLFSAFSSKSCFFHTVWEWESRQLLT